MDYSEALATAPESRPEKSHTGQLPLRRIPSKSADTGRKPEEQEKSTPCKTSGRILPPSSCRLSLLRLTLLQCLKDLLKLFLEPRKLDGANRLLGMQNDVQWQADGVQLTLHGCTQPPPYSVSLYSIPQNLANCKAYARAPIIVAMAIEGRHIPRKIFFAFSVHSLKIRVSQQSRGPGELLPMLFLVLVHIVACMATAREIVQAGYSRYPGLTETRLRPLARRRESTACPLLVFIRVRNPCVLERRRRLGWNVRFGIELWNSCSEFYL